jgi:predicted MPP superfamily phosphohydrolase
MYNPVATRRALDRTFDGAEPGLVRILLAHHPHVFQEAASYQLALTLSGHTHGGGQVVIAEYNGRPIAIGSAVFHYVSGRYEEGGRMLYVNRGIGYVGLPMRINCPPEISRFKLVAA